MIIHSHLSYYTVIHPGRFPGNGWTDGTCSSGTKILYFDRDGVAKASHINFSKIKINDFWL